MRSPQRHRMSRYILTIALATSSILTHANSNVEHTMKQMAHAYRAAVQSRSLVEMRGHVRQLHQYADAASRATYGKNTNNRSAYKDGMRELQTDLDDLDAALAKNDFALAKQTLQQQINHTKNIAHKSLRVDEEDERSEGKQRNISHPSTSEHGSEEHEDRD